MKYTESDKEAIEAILYYQYRIDKAMNGNCWKNHSKRSIWQKLQNIREKRGEGMNLTHFSLFTGIGGIDLQAASGQDLKQ